MITTRGTSSIRRGAFFKCAPKLVFPILLHYVRLSFSRSGKPVGARIVLTLGGERLAQCRFCGKPLPEGVLASPFCNRLVAGPPGASAGQPRDPDRTVECGRCHRLFSAQERSSHCRARLPYRPSPYRNHRWALSYQSAAEVGPLTLSTPMLLRFSPGGSLRSYASSQQNHCFDTHLPFHRTYATSRHLWE
jgi:hypothetical protein